MFQGGFVSWFLFFSFLPFALYGLFISLYSLKEWKITRRIEKFEYNANETMTIEIELLRKSYFPIFYLLVEDVVSTALQDITETKKLLLPGFKRRIKMSYKIDSVPRGEHHFHKTILKVGDPIGLIEKESSIIQPEKIIVYPNYEELSYKSLENHYEQGMTVSKERVQRDTTMAVGIREYQPGDRFSWINWKASAKRNNMMTKEFEQRQSDDLMVVLDTEENVRFETMISFAASLVRAILKKGAQVGLLSVEKERSYFPIRGGEAQQQLLSYHLAKVQCVNDLSFTQVIENESHTLQQHASLLLITTNLKKGLIEKISYLASKRYNISIFLVKDSNEMLSKQEQTLLASASSRGIRIIPVSKGKFKDVFSEVAIR